MEDDGVVVADRRASWVLRYKPAEVPATAERRVQYHVERRTWWEAESIKAEALPRKNGFEYREQHDSLGQGIQIVGDPELAQRVTQCKRKIESHRAEQKVFETWGPAFRAKTERQPGEELELKIEDVLFFEL